MILRDKKGRERLKNKNNPIRFSGTSIHSSGKNRNYDINRYDENFKNPSTVLKVKSERNKLFSIAKPVALMEYLIKTYTNESETVLDFCMGSGTTGVACKNLNRNFIGIELGEEDNGCFELAKERIENHDVGLGLLR